MRRMKEARRTPALQRWQLMVAVVLAAVVGAAGVYGVFRRAASRQSSPPERSQKTGYLNPAVCANCHPQIAATYARTGMGRSFRIAGEQDVPTQRNEAFYHRPSDRYYVVARRGNRFFQRRYQRGRNGEETNVEEKEIHFVLGSGNHSRSYLHRTRTGKMTELPLAWYSENGGYWAMSPGYDRQHHDDFRRRVTYECMFCHNAYPEMRPEAGESGTAPVFAGELPEGIDCQRCHGPGGAHVSAVRNAAGRDAIRAAIVNPSRLARERQFEICMQCHLETTSFPLPYSVRIFERPVFSYRPGEPLSDYTLHFDHAPSGNRQDKFEIVSAVYRLRKSACFQKSGMTCTTCHNPHETLRGAAAIERYTKACQSCHLKPEARQDHMAAGDCLGCHMPKRRTEDVVHVVMTDHYIQRRKPAGDLTAPRAEQSESYRGEVAAYYPMNPPKLYLAVAQVKQSSNLDGGIPLLEEAISREKPERVEFYFELAKAYWGRGQTDQALSMYEEALRRAPDFWPGLHDFGMALAKSGQPERAIDVLRRATALRPLEASAYNGLGLAYLKTHRLDEAIRTLNKAVELDPDVTEAWNNLGGALLEKGDANGAKTAYSSAIRVQPDFGVAHGNLAGLLVQNGEFDAAQYHFERAVEAQPEYAEGWNGLGDVFAMKQEIRRSVDCYRKAVRLNPDFSQAQLSLGSALLATGRRDEAAPHLEHAARSTDRDVSAAAQKALSALRNGGRQKHY